MLNYKEIVRKSNESYNKFFKDLQSKPSVKDYNDIEIDVANMQDIIAEKAKNYGALNNRGV
ncbi:hypothetical protein [Sharpea azabuensis]|uniref:hypothetical protein n=1 Tax=Sharpea azabuensis TaxID=322505 RepID=UPI00156C1DAC|nr:hypothetical protein [Sharpea azabuensis]